MLLAAPPEIKADEKVKKGTIQQATVHLMDFRFEPSQINLEAGKPVELTLVNDGTVLHEFITGAFRNLTVDVDVNGVITEALGIGEFEIPPGAKVVLRFTPLKPNEFSLACRAMKPREHYKEGMLGIISFVSDSP